MTFKSVTDNLVDELAALRGFQEFESTTDPSTAAAQAYTFKLTLNGVAFNSGNDISVTLAALDSLATIATKVATAINTIVASSVTVEKNAITGKVRIKAVNSTEHTSNVLIAAPTAGSSLLTLLGGVGTSVTKPVIVSQKAVIPGKDLPIVKVESPEFRPHKGLSNLKANIRDSMFRVKVYAGTDTYAGLLLDDIRYLIASKSISGGWWKITSDYNDRGESSNLMSVMVLDGKETLWIPLAMTLHKDL
jgi:hypothetical protein